MRRTTSQVEQLRSIPLFAGCSTRELALVDSLAAESRAFPGEILVRQGSPGRETFVILEGEAIVSVGARIVARLRSGDFFGEMALIGRRHLRTATVTALTPMRLMVIDPRQLSTLLQIKGVARQMLTEVVDRLTASQALRPA
jgi:CRP/FNR family cyclic AMP-dependent transcriptional regulator